jgi:transcriptional regulator with XRE-family HTH domain
MAETIGKRIARLRAENGWTQQALAARLAVSRVAVSHIEMDLSLPSERTITLLAGLFKLPPHTLVEGTTYPLAKAERLPSVACQHTGLELETALLQNDLAWLKRLEAAGCPADQQRLRAEVWTKWTAALEACEAGLLDEKEKELLAQARQELTRLYETLSAGG